MPHPPYRPAGLLPLTVGIDAIDNLRAKIRSTGSMFTRFATAANVPPSLSRYYAKVGKKLTVAGTCLDQSLEATALGGRKLSMRLKSSLGQMNLTEEDMNRLRHINNRLLELEKSLEQMVDGMLERLEGLDPPGVEWKKWGAVDIQLTVTIDTNAGQPAHDPDTMEEYDPMPPLKISWRIMKFWHGDTTEAPWGPDEEPSNSQPAGCESYPFDACHLFNELCKHAYTGVRGMLHLCSLWIEIRPCRSGDFLI